MDVQITQLLDTLGQTERPADTLAFLHTLPDVGVLPSPWETWTLIGLIRHRKRQYWVRDIIHSRLRGDCAVIGAMGALGHPEGVMQRGSVPGMPEWEYYFHGRGCRLTHKVTGEEIDVDFWDTEAEYFDVYFYTKYLESLRNPEPPEKRLLELHRSVGPVGIAVSRLLAAGAMTPMPGCTSHPLRLAEDALIYNDVVEAFCLTWTHAANKVWLAAMIGDWLAAHDAATGQPEIQQFTGPRAEKCRAIRRERLLQELERDTPDALFGLAEIGGADAELERVFRGSPSGTISDALEIVGQQNDPKWCPHIYAMFKRLNPAGPLPEPHIWMASLKFLLHHGYKKDEMIGSLAKSGATEIGEGVLLALEHAPENALPLIRQGLLSDIPFDRTAVAAVLALIGKPWSMRELLRVLDASDDQEKTASARAALLETGDPEAKKAVLAWEETNPHEHEPGDYLEVDGRKVGPIFSMAEHMLESSAAYVHYDMERLHDRVMRIKKDVIPLEPHDAKPWWKIWLV